MEQRYFENPYEDYREGNVEVDKENVRKLIKVYVDEILTNTKHHRNGDSRGDVYVGDAGKRKPESNSNMF